MKYHEHEFCALSTNYQFQQWLSVASKNLYDSLITHLRAGSSCGSNRTKMLEILKEADKDVKLANNLYQYLLANHPHVINREFKPMIQVVSGDRHGVFGGEFNPDVVTFPARQIVSGNNISHVVADLVRSYAEVEFLIIDDVAYIEFIPEKFKHLARQVPDSNWKIREWKKRK